jgi:hypothetical protein
MVPNTIRCAASRLAARIEAHIFIAFLAYCLHVTLGRRLHAPGAWPHAAQRHRKVRRRADD